VRLGLTGQLSSEPTDSSNTLLLHEDAWDQELMSQLGLSDLTFPPLRRSDDTAGHITTQVSHRTGLPAGIPVATGAGDILAALLGGGDFSTGKVSLSLGAPVTLSVRLADHVTPARARAAGMTVSQKYYTTPKAQEYTLSSALLMQATETEY